MTDNQNFSTLFPFAKSMYTLGEMLLKDDAGDIGYLSYKNRQNHYYHGKHSPDHPSVFHHWPVGLALMALGHGLGLVSVAAQAAMAQAEADELFMFDEQ